MKAFILSVDKMVELNSRTVKKTCFLYVSVKMVEPLMWILKKNKFSYTTIFIFISYICETPASIFPSAPTFVRPGRFIGCVQGQAKQQ